MQCKNPRGLAGLYVMYVLFGLSAAVPCAWFISAADAAPRRAAPKKPLGKFKVGDRASWKFGNDEFPGVVTQINPQNGWVSVKFDDPSKWGGQHEGPPDQFQKLAKPKSKSAASGDSADNPFETVEERAEKSGPRTWSDKSGKFKIEATLVRVEDDKVTLKRPDGKEVTMPLEKLSDEDQRFLTGEDPADSESGGSATESSATAAGARPIDTSRTSKWSYQPDSSAAPELRGGRFMLGKMEFAEQVTEVFLSPEKSKAIAVTKLNFFDKKRSRVFVCDLKRGKLENAGEFATGQVPLAMTSDMSRVVSSGIDDHGKRDTLTLYDVDGQKVKPRTAWRPYGHDPNQANVAWARFIDQDHLLTANDAGTVVMWDVSEGIEAKYQLTSKGHSTKPAFSSGLKCMAIKADDGIVLIDTLAGKRVGFLPTDGANFGHLAIGPSGTQLASINGSRLRVWDLKSRELANEFDLSGVWGHQSLDWVDDDCLLIDGKYVVDAPHRVLIWTYNSVTFGRLYGNQVWYVEGGDQPVLAAGSVPSEEAKKLVANVDPASILLIKPGQAVSIEAQLASFPQHRDKILADVKRQLEANGMRVEDGGRWKVLISVKPGAPKQVSYRRFGNRQTETFQVNVQQTTVEYMKDGKAVWTSTGSSGVPHIMHLKQGETIEQGIQRQVEEGVAGVGNIPLPKYFAVLPDGKTAGKSKAPESD